MVYSNTIDRDRCSAHFVNISYSKPRLEVVVRCLCCRQRAHPYTCVPVRPRISIRATNRRLRRSRPYPPARTERSRIACNNETRNRPRYNSLQTTLLDRRSQDFPRPGRLGCYVQMLHPNVSMSVVPKHLLGRGDEQRCSGNIRRDGI